MKTTFYIEELNSNSTISWVAVSDWLFQKATHVEFTVIKKEGVSLFANSIQAQFNMISTTKKERWFCKQLFNYQFAKFSLNLELKQLLLSIDLFNNWFEFDLEDPVFYENDKVIFWTISHEKTLFFNPITDLDKITLLDLGLNFKSTISYEINS